MTEATGRNKRRALRARWSEERRRQDEFESAINELEIPARDYAATLLRNEQDQLDVGAIAFEALSKYWDVLSTASKERQWRFVKSRIWWEARKVWRHNKRFAPLDWRAVPDKRSDTDFKSVDDRVVLVSGLRALAPIQLSDMLDYASGMGPTEIAQVRGVSVNTVKSSLRGGAHAAADKIGRG